MKKLALVISGAFLLAGVANAGDTIELTSAQMDNVTAGYYGAYTVVSATSSAGGGVDVYYGAATVGSTSGSYSSGDSYSYGGYSSVSTGAYNTTIAAIYGSGSAYSGASSSVYIGPAFLP